MFCQFFSIVRTTYMVKQEYQYVVGRNTDCTVGVHRSVLAGTQERTYVRLETLCPLSLPCFCWTFSRHPQAFERASHFFWLGTPVRRLICSLIKLKAESGSSYKTVRVFKSSLWCALMKKADICFCCLATTTLWCKHECASMPRTYFPCLNDYM